MKNGGRLTRRQTYRNFVLGTLSMVSFVISRNYGAFIDFSGTSGLLHISEIRNAFVKDINTFLKIGQSVKVKIIDIDAAKGRIKLSMKQLKKS